MRRSEALIELSREHHHALVFSKQLSEIVTLESSQQCESWLVLQPRLRQELLPHFAEEEEMLKRLSLSASQPLVARLLEEHRLLKYYLGSDQVAVIAPFSALLKQHVRFEERELFSWLEKQYGEVRLAEALNTR